MALQSSVLLGVLLILGCAVTSSRTTNSRYSDAKRGSASVNRSSFPEGFIFGAAGSAYQAVEDQVYGIHSLTNIQKR
ncbi:hypothetical protein PS1_029179 [Malus domestica]